MDPIIDDVFLIEKMAGKGGWTFVRLPAVSANYREKFGTVRVSGKIEDYELSSYGLMPIKSGGLFLAIKADIRKKIGKKEGDRVRIVLYSEKQQVTMAVPEDLLLCLEDDPDAYETYKDCDDIQRKAFLDWIAEATNDELRVKRIAQIINVLASKIKKLPF